MALSDLIARLEQEAQSQVAAIEHEAEAAIRALEDDTDREIRDLTARHLERERGERQIVQQQAVALARRHARAREIEARHAQIARILERARAVASEIAASESYAKRLPSHLDTALSFVEGLRPRVRCQSAFAPLLRDTLARHGGADLVVDESVGPGIVVEAADGSVVVDDTLAARIARAESWLTVELSRKLDDANQ